MTLRLHFQSQRFSNWLCPASALALCRTLCRSAVIGLALVGLAGKLSAQPSESLAGRWQAEPMTVRWVIGAWGDACGPRPSGGGDTGGVVTVEEHGEELSIADAAHSFSTAECWAMHPELDRATHQGGSHSWSSTCRTRPNDPRQEILQTSVTATEDVISFRESGQYQFSVGGQTCSASSGRWRTYRRLAPDTLASPPGSASHSAPSTAPSTPAPSVVEPESAHPPEAPHADVAPPPAAGEGAGRAVAASPCSTPGAPARIEVRPARKLMRAGESFQFRASVVDGHGCVVRTPVLWSIVPAGGAARLMDGLLQVSAGAPDAKLAVVATAARQSVQVAVEVVSADRYTALLGTGHFNADGASADAATATITAGSLGAQQDEPESEPSGRKWTFVALVSGIALLLGLVGSWLLARAQRRRTPAARKSKAPDLGTVVFNGEGAPPAPPGAAVTHTRRPAGSASTQLESISSLSAGQPATVCPVCGTLYPTRELTSCPKDGAQLLPVNA